MVRLDHQTGELVGFRLLGEVFFEDGPRFTRLRLEKYGTHSPTDLAKSMTRSWMK